MRVTATHPRILEPLAKVVASQDEVRKYMDDVMDNMTRAEYVYIAMQLPKENELESLESGVVNGKEQDSASTPPVNGSSGKKGIRNGVCEQPQLTLHLRHDSQP